MPANKRSFIIGLSADDRLHINDKFYQLMTNTIGSAYVGVYFNPRLNCVCIHKPDMFDVETKEVKRNTNGSHRIQIPGECVKRLKIKRRKKHKERTFFITYVVPKKPMRLEEMVFMLEYR